MNDALMENALRLRRAGRFAEAAQIYDEVLRGEPAHFGALHQLGILRYQSGQLEEAERLIGRAIDVNPGAADALYNRGSLLLRLGRIDDAIASFDRAIAVKPDYVEALTNRGTAFARLSRHAAALVDFLRVAQLRPNFAEAWINLAGAEMKLQRYVEAHESAGKGLALKSDMAHAWLLHGNAAALLGRPDEALTSYDRALKLRPGDADALFGRADALLLLRRFAEAAQDYQKLLAAGPPHKFPIDNLVFCKLQLCDWGSLKQDKNAIRAAVLSDETIGAPFPSFAIGWAQTPAELLPAMRKWTNQHYPAQNPLWRGEVYAHDKIRVAYLSANFNEHAVARLMAGVFAQHDRKRFQTMAVSFGPDDGSAMRARLMGDFDRFLDARGKTDSETAELIREAEIDIAVDLMGFTEGCRTGILAARPAPLQVNFLGYPGTMAASYIDYIIGDAIVIPPAHRGGYSEHVVTLPDCYMPADATRRIGKVTPSRQEAGLPERGFVFCCFNSSYKFAPEMFDVWMRLLRAVPESVLWLPKLSAPATENLAREARARGADLGRLIFAPFVPSEEDHLARLGLADLFLDTLPYNAHATASDALWAGVPVLTCSGESFPGRVAASLLHAAGLPELVTGSLAEYEAMALRLAGDAAALSTLRAKLARNRTTHPLFDTARFTHNLEMAFTAMWQNYRNGQAPADIAVAGGAVR